MNRKGAREKGWTSPVHRRGERVKKARGRVYVFVRARERRRQKETLPGVLYRRRVFAAAALIAILLIVFYCDLLRRPAPQQLPPIDVQAEGGSAGAFSDSPYLAFLQRIMGQEIPGLALPAAGGHAYSIFCAAVRSLTGIDPREPCTVLDLELGMGRRVAITTAGTSPAPDPGSEPLPDPPDSEAPPWGDSAFPFPIPGYGEAPILLFHTHASEAFTAGSGESTAAGRTVVTAGVELARLLEENYGLQVLHHCGIYDQPRNYSYSKIRPVIEGIVADNCGIKMIIDLHRDGVARAKTTARLEGEDYAAILLVVGSHNPAYQENLRLALALDKELEAVLPGLSRGLYERDFTYNQDLHPCALLIEVGGHENSIDEALRCLPYLAEALARTYYVFFMQD